LQGTFSAGTDFPTIFSAIVHIILRSELFVIH
jgi:hypothetical protein